MMSDLSLVGCYNMTYMPPEERNRVMLASAKRNLAAMAFFGLTEFQKARYVLIYLMNKAVLDKANRSTLQSYFNPFHFYLTE